MLLALLTAAAGMTLTADSADSEAVSEGGECCREEEELEAALDSYLRKDLKIGLHTLCSNIS